MNVSPWQHCLWRRKSCFLGQKEKGQSLCVVQRAETSSSLCVFSRVCHAHCEEVCSISFTSVASLLLGEVDLVWGQQRWCKRQNNTDWVSSSAAGGLVSYFTLSSLWVYCYYPASRCSTRCLPETFVVMDCMVWERYVRLCVWQM